VGFETPHEQRLATTEQAWDDWAREKNPWAVNDELRCGARPPRVPVGFETPHEQRLATTEQAWDDWAREKNPWAVNDELRFSA
jgi:hypothetical protein